MAGRPGMLFAVLAIALLHPLLQARVRPLYQVSDEMAYLRAAQLEALPMAEAWRHPCIAPPDGVPLEVGEGGKRGFRHVTALQLASLCAGGRSVLPLFALRAWQAVSLPLIALAAWYLARRLTRHDEAGLLAALAVAVHPVAAKYAGGITPDAWANLFSAGALVGLTRVTADRFRWWDIGVVTACTVAALLWKDTANMLVPLVAMVVAWATVRHVTQGRGRDAGTRHARLRGVGGVGLAMLAAVGAARAWPHLVSRYVEDIPEAQAAALGAPLGLALAVVQDMLVHAGGLLASAVLSLYRPFVYGPYATSGQPLTPDGAAALLVALLLAGVAGGLWHWVRPAPALHPVPARVFGLWGVTLALALAQPSIRQVLLDLDGLHQGRWLLPALAPIAAWVGIGIARLGTGRPVVLPLAVLAGLASLWLVVLDIVGHYYVRFPDVLRTPMLFTRPTGETDIGDARVVHLIEQTLAAQSPLWTWGILVLLAAASAWLAVSAIRQATATPPHA